MHRATIAKSPGLSGKVEWRLGKNDSTHSKLFVVMAGPIAEHHALGTPCSFHGHAQDNQIIRDLIAVRYKNERDAPEFQRALLAAWDFVRRRQHSIHRVAKLLLAKSTARHSEIAQAM